MNRLRFLLLGSLSVAACSNGGESACADGSEGCPCYGNDTCDDSMVCNPHSVCVVHDVSGTDAGDGASGGSLPEQCELFPANLAVDTTIPAGCYTVRSFPSMDEGVDVTLSAGVTLTFTEGVWFEIPYQGSLLTLGTREAPVVFTSANEQRGSWGGILAPRGSIELNHTIVEYAGAEIPGTERMGCVSDIAAGVRVGSGDYASIRNSTLRNNRGAGAAFAVSECLEVEFDENTLTGNDLPLVTSAHALDALGRANGFGGNTKDHIQLVSDHTGGAATWGDLGVPIFASRGLTVESSLVLTAGVTIQFTPGTRLVVEGSLLASGTEEHPVVLESVEAGEAWKGVECADDGSVDLSNTVLVDAPATACD